MPYRKLRPMLWRTTSRDVPCYLFAVMHWPEDWARRLPRGVHDAIDASGCVCVEHIPKGGLAERLESSYHMSPKALVRTALGTLHRRLTRTALKAQDATGAERCSDTVLDMYLVRRMRGAGKLVVELEREEEQLAAVGALSDFGTAYPPTVNPLSFPWVHKAYMSGDAEGLERSARAMHTPTGVCWIERQIRIARRLLDLLRETPATGYFVALGATHLLGPANVRELLDVGGVPTERVS